MEIFLECNGLAQLQSIRQKKQEIKPDLLCNADQDSFIPALPTSSSIILALQAYIDWKDNYNIQRK